MPRLALPEWLDPERILGGLGPVPSAVVLGGVGLLLLVFGRRLYWFLLGVVGFALGFGLISGLAPAAEPWWLPYAAGAIGGVVGVAAAIFIQGALLVLVGGVLGAFATLLLVSLAEPIQGVWIWVAVLAGAVLGAVVLRGLFAAALIVASSVVGAVLILRAVVELALPASTHEQVGPWIADALWNLSTPTPVRLLVFIALVILGISYQSVSTRQLKREQQIERRHRHLEKEIRRLARQRRGDD